VKNRFAVEEIVAILMQAELSTHDQCRLKRSMQHLFGAYSLEFGILERKGQQVDSSPEELPQEQIGVFVRSELPTT